MKRKQPAQHAIYLRDECGDWVLLKSGAWITPQSADIPERHGRHITVLYEVEKFSTREAAMQFRRARGINARSYVDLWPKPQPGERA